MAQASTPKEKEDLHEQLDAVRQQLTLLLNWVEVNFVAVGKILKKHGALTLVTFSRRSSWVHHRQAHGRHTA